MKQRDSIGQRDSIYKLSEQIELDLSYFPTSFISEEHEEKILKSNKLLCWWTNILESSTIAGFRDSKKPKYDLFRHLMKTAVQYKSSMKWHDYEAYVERI